MSPPKIKHDKYAEALTSIPEHLWPIYEQLVNDYKYFCLTHYGKAFVSYTILAELVNAGWRPSSSS